MLFAGTCLRKEQLIQGLITDESRLHRIQVAQELLQDLLESSDNPGEPPLQTSAPLYTCFL
jgi:hypothetical protein